MILINGRPASTVRISQEANAIIEGWYLGEQTGNAVADVLFGDANPGGKLPVTIPRSVGQLPMFYNAKPSARRGYLLDTTDPLYAFGYGLSYTTFELSAPRLSAARMGRRAAFRFPWMCAILAHAPATKPCSCMSTTGSVP